MKLAIIKYENDDYLIEKYDPVHKYEDDVSIIDISDDIAKSYFKLQSLTYGFRQIVKWMYKNGQLI